VVILDMPLFSFGGKMLSILMTPFNDTDTFSIQHKAIVETIDTEHEIICTLLDGDNMREWFEVYFAEHNIRYMLVPDLGYTNLINILAARAHGDYLYYVSPYTVIGSDVGWGRRAISALSAKDSVCGGLLSATINDINCTGLFLPIRTFHILGYYNMPLFETSVYGTRWAASILTDAGRLVNIPCGVEYNVTPHNDNYTTDRDMFNVTRAGRMMTLARLSEFMEKKDD